VTLPGVLFLAGFTARSQAYAQAMARAGLAPAWVTTFGNPAKDQADRTADPDGAEAGALFLPDLTRPLRDTCADAGWPADHLAAADINDDSIARHLVERRPRLVVYSGYGGQLVKPAIINLGFDILHLHSGWLPDYRGSTTIYYSWLREGRCGVTALILDSGIDTGPIVARRHYPAPPPGIDVDKVYDSAIRADLLVDVLKDYARADRLERKPNPDGGRTYYVVHPVLKHVALISREDAPAAGIGPTVRLKA